MMGQEYQQSSSDSSGVRWVPYFIRHDFWRKAIALFFAFLIYFIVSVKIGQERKISNVPVEIDLPTTLACMDKKTPQVNLSLKGSKQKLNEVTASSIKIRVPVDETLYNPGIPYTLRLNNQHVRVPFGISIVDIDPRELTLNLDRKVTARVPIAARFDSENTLRNDFAVGQVRFNPSEVRISGPETIVREIVSVQTSPIPLDGLVADSFEYRVGLVAQDGVVATPDVVNARVEIVRKYATRVFQSIPIRLLASVEHQANTTVEFLSSPNVEVTLKGPQSTLALMRPTAIKPYVDASAFQEAGTYSVDVTCWLDTVGDITVTNIYPAKVQIKVTTATN